jgi:hypothetical protein
MLPVGEMASSPNNRRVERLWSMGILMVHTRQRYHVRYASSNLAEDRASLLAFTHPGEVIG